MRSDDLIRCLEATPSLVELKLSFESCKSNLTDGVLHRLTRGASDGYLTPNLEVIELDLYKSTCTDQALVKMIQSRWSMDASGMELLNARLKTVQLSSVSFQFDLLTNAQLGILVEEGLRLSVTDKRL